MAQMTAAWPAVAADDGPPALAIRGLTKRFSQQLALDDVGLVLRRGEIHGLVGENGSGKSTLIKILAGFYRADEGVLEVAGAPSAFPERPGEFSRLGFAFVHQDLGLILDLTVAENLALVHLACDRGGWCLPRRALLAEARATLERFEVGLDPVTPVGALTPVDRALLAIVRAVAVDPRRGSTSAPLRLLVLDEPTVFLPRRDVVRLFALVRRIAAEGAAVLFVSHDPDEVRELCHAVTVLRDGAVVGKRAVHGLGAAELVEMIVGRPVDGPARPELTTVRPGGVHVERLEGTTVHGVDLSIGAGEILGVTGLAGSGYAELPYLLYGAGATRRGTLRLGAETVELDRLRPRRAVHAGMVLIPGDRRRDGIFESLPVTDNVTLPRLGELRTMGTLSRRRLVAETRSLMTRFDVRPAQPALALGALSGGNQQKAVLAKWLSTAPRLVMLDEPTQGVDVGARQQIFAALREVAATGASVLVASSDAEQLAALCHRVVVLDGGRVSRELMAQDVTKDVITRACFGADDLVAGGAGAAGRWR